MVNFQNANLTNANLSKAKLNGANFNKANLTNANLSGADLTSVTLLNAILKRVNLRNTDLKGAAYEIDDLIKNLEVGGLIISEKKYNPEMVNLVKRGVRIVKYDSNEYKYVDVTNEYDDSVF